MRSLLSLRNRVSMRIRVLLFPTDSGRSRFVISSRIVFIDDESTEEESEEIREGEMNVGDLPEFDWSSTNSDDEGVNYSYVPGLLNGDDTESSTRDIAGKAARKDGLIMDALLIPLEVESMHIRHAQEMIPMPGEVIPYVTSNPSTVLLLLQILGLREAPEGSRLQPCLIGLSREHLELMFGCMVSVEKGFFVAISRYCDG